MNKKIAIFLLGILTITQLSGCVITDFFNKSAKIARFNSDKVARAQTPENTLTQDLEILDSSKKAPALTFTKSAIVQSQETASITAQTSGKVTEISVKVGDKVKKDALLITLGNSLVTDMAEIQYQTALKALSLAQNSQIFSDNTSKQTIQMAALGVKTAYEALQNAKKAKENAEDIYEEQLQGAKIGKNSATEAKEFAASSLDKLKTTISSLKQKRDNLSATLSQLSPADSSYDKLSETLGKLEEAIATTEGQADTIEFSKETAARGIDQAENGIDLLEESFQAQQSQMEFAITAADAQYEMALKQFQSAFNGTNIQKFGIDTQILQLSSASQIAQLNNAQKYIKSPIEGVVTEIQTSENDFVGQGQPIVKIENPAKILLKTSINTDEVQFIELNQEVTIKFSSTKTTGKITSISPALNQSSKKIDIEIEADNTSEIPLESLVRVEIPAKTTGHIFLPLNSIYNNEQGQFVKIMESNQIKSKRVELGEVIGDYVEIKEGLSKKDKVIITPNIL